MKQVLSILFCCAWLLGMSQSDETDILSYSLPTKWADQVDTEKPWNIYPRPQMKRSQWINLNGEWEYAIQSKDLVQPTSYDGTILVPFAVESELSGVKKTVGENNYLWYKKQVPTPKLGRDEALLLHFGAVDWEATVFVNGQQIGHHKGGYTPFSFDVSPYLKGKNTEIVVRVWDPTDQGTQARGKQVKQPSGIWYTPVTGIWQTVWLERVPQQRIEQVKTTPDIDREMIAVEVATTPLGAAGTLHWEISLEGKTIHQATTQVSAATTSVSASLPVADMQLWAPETPVLYDLNIVLKDAQGDHLDAVQSYFGMRKISMGKDPNGYTVLMLNNEPHFEFGLLDQGWWPDGLYTAPTPEALMYDVEVTKDLGFNMLRKHVKVEPAYYYYRCDQMGMIVWQDMPNGNYRNSLRIQAWEPQDARRPDESTRQFERELKELVDAFYPFPSIVMWVPFNEGWGQYDTKRVTHWLENYDPSRLVNSPSGWTDRGVGDVIDVHLYPGPGMEMAEEDRISVLGEFGGLGYPVKDHLWWDKRNWGYLTFQEEKVFVREFKEVIQDLIGLKAWGLSAAIYTQTTDVEGEVNGLMTYDREVLKLKPSQTKAWLAPLYQPMWNRRLYVMDSEHSPQSWKITHEEPDGQWMTNSFNDADWTTASGPFSSFHNFFLPDQYHKWNPGQQLYARKTFSVQDIPDQLYLKYYLIKSEADIYINGQKITSIKHQGGRKRHYAHSYHNDIKQHLNKGLNTIAIVVKSMEQECSFDVGLYGTAPINGESKDGDFSKSSYDE